MANQALKDKQLSDTYHRIGMVVEGGTAEDFTRLYLQDVQRWTRVVRESGLTLD